MQEHNGVLPADAILMPGHAVPGSEGEQWYLVSRVSAVRGKDLRDAQPSRDQNGQPAVSFTLTNEGAQRFYSFTSKHGGDSHALALDDKVHDVANLREPLRDHRHSSGHMTEQQTK